MGFTHHNNTAGLSCSSSNVSSALAVWVVLFKFKNIYLNLFITLQKMLFLYLTLFLPISLVTMFLSLLPLTLLHPSPFSHPSIVAIQGNSARNYIPGINIFPFRLLRQIISTQVKNNWAGEIWDSGEDVLQPKCFRTAAFKEVFVSADYKDSYISGHVSDTVGTMDWKAIH